MVKVRVTQDHIDRGKPEDCEFCPVNLAIRDILAEGFTCATYPEYISIDNEKERRREWANPYLPMDVVDFIAAVDFGESVQPIEFDLDIPNECLKMSNVDNKGEKWKEQSSQNSVRRSGAR